MILLAYCPLVRSLATTLAASTASWIFPRFSATFSFACCVRSLNLSPNPIVTPFAQSCRSLPAYPHLHGSGAAPRPARRGDRGTIHGVDNAAIADQLEAFAAVLELGDANPYTIRAHQRAAET